MGLLDFLQSASNSAASNVTAPVDGIAWLLRKAGLDVGEPMGGSDWAKRKGLMRDVPQSAASLGGEMLGLLGPMVAAAKAPQIARGLLQGAENLAAPARLSPQLGATVWHGSPHNFNKFDAGKIGTGEGAQAYGHGLYLAEHPAVAKGYKEALSAGRGIGDDDVLARALDALGGDGAKVAAEFERRAKYANMPGGKEAFAELAKKARAGYDPRGSLYKVDLPDEHIAKMLDWDKPLSQQAPGVQAAMQRSKQSFDQIGVDPSAARAIKAMEDVGYVTNKHGKGMAGVSEYLRQQGIPGIRYLDGGSRAGGAGTSNYVVFPGNEDLLKILERNGIPVR